MTDRQPYAFFLTLEGIDGAGKSSHLVALREHFEAMCRAVVMTREPDGTPLAEARRQMILQDAMDLLTEALLIFAARRDHIVCVSVIARALARGDVGVCDRFTDSTFAYQGLGHRFPLQVLEQLEQWVQAELQPDLTLWFDLSPEVAATRLADARAPGRFEGEQLEFFSRVRAGYAARAEQVPERFVRVDAEETQHEIWKRIESALANAPSRSNTWSDRRREERCADGPGVRHVPAATRLPCRGLQARAADGRAQRLGSASATCSAPAAA